MRYTANVLINVYADTDEQAVRRINRLLAKLDKKHDNNPKLVGLVQNNFGSLENREIKL